MEKMAQTTRGLNAYQLILSILFFTIVMIIINYRNQGNLVCPSIPFFILMDQRVDSTTELENSPGRFA